MTGWSEQKRYAIEKDLALKAYKVTATDLNHFTMGMAMVDGKLENVALWSLYIPDLVLHHMGKMGLLDRYLSKEEYLFREIGVKSYELP